jgi:hypothetical protein
MRLKVTAMLVFAAFAGSRPAIAALDAQEAAMIFAEAKIISDRDNRQLWGVPLYGPMLLIDPRDRAAIANQQDANGRLVGNGASYVGALTNDVMLADTPNEWMGTRWTQLLMPMSYEPARRHVTLAHELFHRIQPMLGLARALSEQMHHLCKVVLRG